MLATRTREKIRLSVLRPTSSPLFLPIIEPASATSIPMGAYRPTNITMAVETLKKTVFPDAPRKSEPLFAAAEVNS